MGTVFYYFLDFKKNEDNIKRKRTVVLYFIMSKTIIVCR